MKYRCLILDHDDTVVNSTATIHYPAFLAFMEKEKPEIHYSLEEYFLYNFEPGVLPFFRDICGLTQEQTVREEAFWHSYVKEHIPAAYSGIREILRDYHDRGGIICVVSHSFSEYIRRDYAYNDLPVPDLIFGWDMKPENRKPSPYAVYEIEKAFCLNPSEILILDDLKPGCDMAKAAGVSIAGAGWANSVPRIEAYMRSHCDYYLKTVSELQALLRD